MSTIVLPDDSQRISIIGATGSGKTVAGLWHLSHRHYEIIPWVIYNFKGDSNIDSIPHARHIGLDEIPSGNGIYIAHPKPGEEEELEHHMRAIWDAEGIGVFVDEGLMVGQHNTAFRLLLTQGRSKNIPMIICSQRPKWMDVFVFSESEFYQVFRLQFKGDRKAVEEFIPIEDKRDNSGRPMNLSKRLPRYWSYYYNAIDDKLDVLKPVPKIETILATFERRLRGRSVAV